MSVLRIGTRGSALAVAQTRAVADRLERKAGVEVELVTVTTKGDTSAESLASLGGSGVFAGALREALLAEECDVIVHSYKDLPTATFDGLALGAVPKRADPRDVLVARDELTLEALPDGARVGTGSPRRVAQLRAARADLEVVDIRGNVDTRIGFVESGELDAVVLAAAGLDRLGRSSAATDVFPLSAWPTAPAQGALALEVRERDAHGDSALARALFTVNHVTTRATATAERAVLAGLEAGCAAPVGVTSLVDDGLLFVTATVYSLDGGRSLTASHAVSLEGAAAHALLAAALEAAQRVVDELLENGAADLAPVGSAS